MIWNHTRLEATWMSSMRDSWWHKALRLVHGDTGLAISEIRFPEHFPARRGHCVYRSKIIWVQGQKREPKLAANEGKVGNYVSSWGKSHKRYNPRGGGYGEGTRPVRDRLGGKVMSLEEGSESRNSNCQRENLIFVFFTIVTWVAPRTRNVISQSLPSSRQCCCC